MSKVCLIVLAAAVFLTACNSAGKPNDANFKQAINQYLAKHGRACTWIGSPFPVDVPEAEQRSSSGIGFQMAVLEGAGLVGSSDTVVVIPGLLGSGGPRRVRRYEPTAVGRRYLQQAPGIFGQSPGFCYGSKSVDFILKWTEPATVGGATQTEVTYTYRIADLASWATRPDVQSAFGDVRATVNGISKSNEIIDLQLTNRGWEVPAQ